MKFWALKNLRSEGGITMSDFKIRAKLLKKHESGARKFMLKGFCINFPKCLASDFKLKGGYAEIPWTLWQTQRKEQLAYQERRKAEREQKKEVTLTPPPQSTADKKPTIQEIESRPIIEDDRPPLSFFSVLNSFCEKHRLNDEDKNRLRINCNKIYKFGADYKKNSERAAIDLMSNPEQILRESGFSYLADRLKKQTKEV